MGRALTVSAIDRHTKSINPVVAGGSETRWKILTSVPSHALKSVKDHGAFRVQCVGWKQLLYGGEETKRSRKSQGTEQKWHKDWSRGLVNMGKKKRGTEKEKDRREEPKEA